MFSVDFPLRRLFCSPARLAGIAIALTLSLGFSGVTTPDAFASSKVWHKSGKHFSVKTRHTGSRRFSRHASRNNYRHNSRRNARRGAGRHYGQAKYRGIQRRHKNLKYRSHRRQFEGNHRGNYRNHLFARRSLRDLHSSGFRRGYRNYNVRSQNYDRSGLVVTNQHGVRVISNYGRSYNDQYYSPGASINGVSINDKCPLNFRCGLRAYDDNSGPRIIHLGKGANSGVSGPAMGNIAPPKVITYSNSTN